MAGGRAGAIVGGDGRSPAGFRNQGRTRVSTSGASFRKKYVRVSPMFEKLGGSLSENCRMFGGVQKLSEH